MRSYITTVILKYVNPNFCPINFDFPKFFTPSWNLWNITPLIPPNSMCRDLSPWLISPVPPSIHVLFSNHTILFRSISIKSENYKYNHILVWSVGADPLILVKISFFFLLENSLHVWGHYVLHFYKAIATRNSPKKGPKNGGYR